MRTVYLRLLPTLQVTLKSVYETKISFIASFLSHNNLCSLLFEKFKHLLEVMRLKEFLHHCVKSVRIQSYSGPHFPVFGLNTEKYSVSLRVQSECGKMRTSITPNTGTFYAVYVNIKNRTENLRAINKIYYSR